MMILALLSTYLLVLEFTVDLTPSQIKWFGRIDMTVALIFLTEFCIKFYIAKSKRKFFMTHWWELLAAIPVTTPTTQSMRLIRFLRLIRLIRLIRVVEGVQEILDYLERFAKQTYLVYVLTVWSTIIFCSTLVFHAFEHSINSRVRNLFDSFWWAMTTVTTVGFGDIYPVTVGGRIVGIFLMMGGIGTSMIFTALVASFLVRQHIKQQHRSEK
jgi:voltage-gated potassium channel